MPVGVLFFSSDYISYDMTPEQFLDVSWGRLLLLQPGITGRTKSTMRSRQTTKTPAGLASRVTRAAKKVRTRLASSSDGQVSAAGTGRHILIMSHQWRGCCLPALLVADRPATAAGLRSPGQRKRSCGNLTRPGRGLARRRQGHAGHACWVKEPGETVVYSIALAYLTLPAIHRPREAWLAQPVDIFGRSDD
jgi:hypothetical protein